MDYEAMWNDLEGEVQELIVQGVRSVDPRIVFRFMSYIEQKESYLEQLKSRDTDAAAKGV